MDEPEPDPVMLPIEDALDLHPFAPRDVRSVVDEYLRQAAARGFREVRLIHGKGTGTQRAIVRSVLAGHPAVERVFYCSDPKHPDAEVIAKLFTPGLYSAILSFEIRDADRANIL